MRYIVQHNLLRHSLQVTGKQNMNVATLNSLRFFILKGMLSVFFRFINRMASKVSGDVFQNVFFYTRVVLVSKTHVVGCICEKKTLIILARGTSI